MFLSTYVTECTLMILIKAAKFLIITWYLGFVRALENVEGTYCTAIIRVEKLSEAAELELYRDSIKHDYLVISGVLWFGCS